MTHCFCKNSSPVASGKVVGEVATVGGLPVWTITFPTRDGATADPTDPAGGELVLVQSADALSGARPGARKEMLQSYVKRLEDLEKIANGFKGVDKSYAIQAGRDLRIIVDSQRVRDEETVLLSRDIAKAIEEQLTYPGQIRVTVIRETRAVEYAK